MSRALTIVTSKISPSVSVCACYCLTLLVSNFYLGEMYTCSLLLSTSIPGDGMYNWWPVMTKEVELISQCLWIMICTSEGIFSKTRPQGILSYRVSTFKEAMAKNLSSTPFSGLVLLPSPLSTFSNSSCLVRFPLNNSTLTRAHLKRSK